MSNGAEVSDGNISWCIMPKPYRHHRAVVKFQSRSEKAESKTEGMNPGSVATARTTTWWPHQKQPNRQETWDRVVFREQ